MLVHILTFSNELNASVQVGDIVYYTTPNPIPGSGTSSVNNIGLITQFGFVYGVYPNGQVSPLIPPNSIEVVYDETVVPLPLANDYIMFGKDKQLNSSSLIGYYAEAQFVNYSTGKVELFSVGSEVSESSK